MTVKSFLWVFFSLLAPSRNF